MSKSLFELVRDSYDGFSDDWDEIIEICEQDNSGKIEVDRDLILIVNSMLERLAEEVCIVRD